MQRPLNEEDVSLIAEFAKALVPTHGERTLATIKKVTDSTRNVRDIIKQLATEIEDEMDRDDFIRRAKRAVLRQRAMRASRTAEKMSAPQAKGNEQERRFSELTPAQMACAEEVLSPTLGEKTSVLVARYASSTDTSRDFFEQLGAHLNSAKERSMLFVAARKVPPKKNNA